MQQNNPRSAVRPPNDLVRAPRRLPALAVFPVLFLALLMVGGQPFASTPVHAINPASGAMAPSARAVSSPATGVLSAVHTGTILLSRGLTGGLRAPTEIASPTGSSLLATPGVAAHPASDVRPATGSSTASNFVVDNQTDPTSIVTVGGSNSTLLLASGSSADLDNGSYTLPGLVLTPSVYFFKYGFSSIYRSTDGGTSWSTTWVPRNASWIATGGALSGEIGVGVNQLAAAGSGGATGGKVFGVEGFEQACLADFEFQDVGPANCTSTVNATGPMGIAVTESTDGGQSWGAARPLAYSDPYPWKYFPGNSSVAGCNPGYTFFAGNYTSDAHISYSTGSGVIVVTWLNTSYFLSGFTCINGGPAAHFSEASTEWMSISTNGGASFSAPVHVSNGVIFTNTLPAQLETFSSTAIGPGPTYADYAIWTDLANSTSTTIPFQFTKSTNNGTTWSTPADIGNLAAYPILSAAPGSFLNWSGPTLVADNWSGSSYEGNLYLFWNDNRSAPPGYPSIAFSKSTDGGITWSTPIYITPNVPSTTRFFQPSATVDPNGTIWVEYYGESLATSNNGAGLLTGTYDTYGTYSSNGGSSWAPQFRIDDTTSNFEASGNFVTGALGGPTLVGSTDGVYAAWSDCRGVSCPGVGLFQTPSAYVAHLNVVSLNANITGVNETVTEFGPSTTYALPASAVFETGALIGVSVPSWLPDTPSTIYAYQNFSGFASSTANPASLSYPGHGTLTVNYKPEPAGWIAGTVGPYAPGLVVTINGMTTPLTPFNATADQFNATIAAGFTYLVTAVRAGYTPYSQSVPTQAGKVSPQNIWLPRENGWISGKLTPANATLMVNSTLVAVNPNGGAFNQTVTWGQYWVNASESGYTTFSQLVVVSPEQTSAINPTLVGGWITGSINPLSGAVQINGAPVTLQAGNFNVSEPGGTYELTARAPGYSWFHWTVTVTPGHAVTKNIRLTNQGYIVGTIGPANAIPSAIVLVAGSQVRLNASGGFNASEGPGSHTVSASATNYNQSSTTVTVVAGNVTWANITLKPSTQPGQNCTVTNTCSNNNNTGGTGSSSNLLLYAGIGAAVVLAAIIAGVLLMRRRPPAQDADMDSSPPAAYDESAESGGTPPST